MEDRPTTRTLRLLEARLEALASACERAPSVERGLDEVVLRIEVATRHAVRLELLSAEDVGAVWAEVARRHPGVPWCRSGPRLAA